MTGVWSEELPIQSYADALPLTFSFGGLSSRITLPYPNLNGYAALKLEAADVARVPGLLKGQVPGGSEPVFILDAVRYAESTGPGAPWRGREGAGGRPA